MHTTSQEAAFARTTIYTLVFAVPLIILPNTIANIFTTPKVLLILAGASLLAAVYLIRFLLNGDIIISESPVTHLIILIFILNIITFFYTKNIYYSKIAVRMNVTCLFIFYFISLYINDAKTAFRIFVCIAMGGLLVSVITYLDYVEFFRQFSWAENKTRLTSTIGNANYLGTYLIFPLFALSGLFFISKGVLRYLCLLSIAISFGAFLLTESRAPWFGFVAAFPVFCLLIKNIFAFSFANYMRSNTRRIVISILLILFLLPGVWMLAPQKFQDSMKPEKLLNPSTLKIRTKYWRASLQLIFRNPLFGTGLWSYRNQVYEAQAQIAQTDPDFFTNYDQKPRRAHNDFLEILNDGGLVAAVCLLLFYTMIMRNGYRTIKNADIGIPERVITATAFSSIVGVTVTAILFFPFRVYSTLFMTVVMMGIMEGIYVRSTGLLRKMNGAKVVFPPIFITFIILLFAWALWFSGYRPFMAEREYYKYLNAFANRNVTLTEKHILNAVAYDPESTRYCFYAGEFYKNIKKDTIKSSVYLNRAIVNFNGDMTKWSVLYTDGLMRLNKGSIFEARRAFLKSLYYYPEFTPARDKLMEIEKLIQENDKICIRLK